MRYFYKTFDNIYNIIESFLLYYRVVTPRYIIKKEKNF